MAKPKARFDWRNQQHLCSGCSEDYIETGDNTVRLWRRDSHFVCDDLVGDPMLRMEEGIPIIYYNTSHQSVSWEPRILKVDNKLEFLYLLQDPSTLGSARLSAQEPVILKLHRIIEIHGQAQAIRICDAHNIQNSHLTLDSAVVIQFGGEKDEPNPPVDKILVLMVAHQQRLKMCIDTCLSVLPAEAEAEVKNRYAAQQIAPKRGRLPKDERSILGRVILPNVGQVFDHAQERFDFSVSVRATKAEAKLFVNHDLRIEDCDDEVGRVQTALSHDIPNTILFPLDCARLSLVLSETVMLRHTAMERIGPGFDGRFWRYISETSLPCVVMPDDSFTQTEEHNRRELRKDQPSWDHPHERCCEPAMRACLLAVEQMLEMESTYHELALWGRDTLADYEIPLLSSLSGTIEPWMEVAQQALPASLPDDAIEDAPAAGGASGTADGAAARTDPAPLAVLGQQLESRSAPPQQRLPEVPSSAPTTLAPGDVQHSADPIYADPPEYRRPPSYFQDTNGNHPNDHTPDMSRDDFDDRHRKMPLSVQRPSSKQAGFCAGARVCTNGNGRGIAGECSVQ